jgi:membrane dipeptidase
VTQARAIHQPLAEKIAKKGGVVGVWPIGSQFRSLEAYADRLIELAGVLGPEHVGVGSDTFGLPTTVIPGYEAFPALEEIFIKRGVSAGDSANILGRNYLRVLRQALAA